MRGIVASAAWLVLVPACHAGSQSAVACPSSPASNATPVRVRIVHETVDTGSEEFRLKSGTYALDGKIIAFQSPGLGTDAISSFEIADGAIAPGCHVLDADLKFAQRRPTPYAYMLPVRVRRTQSVEVSGQAATVRLVVGERVCGVTTPPEERISAQWEVAPGTSLPPASTATAETILGRNRDSLSIDVREATHPTQHLVELRRSRAVFYAEPVRDASWNFVAYVEPRPHCPHAVRLTGTVIQATGTSKRPDSTEQGAEDQLDVSAWRCL